MAGMRYQPQGLFRINRKSPLARGLVIAVVAGHAFNIVTGKPLVVTTAPAIAAGPQGKHFAFNGNANSVYTTDYVPGTITTHSGLVVARSSSLSGEAAFLSTRKTQNKGFAFAAVNKSSTGTVPNQGAPFRYTNAALADYETGRIQNYGSFSAIGFSATDGSDVRFFQGGFLGGSMAIGSMVQTSDPVSIGGDQFFAQAPNCDKALILYWNRRLSDAEHAAIAANPYQVLDDLSDDDEIFLAAGGAGATATPSGVSSAASVGTVSASAGAQAAPAGVSAAASVGVAVGSAGASTAPVGVTASASVGTVTATAGARATPAGVGAAGQIGTPAAFGGAAAAPAGVSASASVGAATATGGSASTAFPAGVTAVASVGAPVASAGATAAPVGVGALAQVGTATATGGSASTAVPAGVSATASVGQVSASGGASAAPQGVTASASVGTASATAGSSIPGTATPAGVGASASVGTAAGSGGAGCAPAGVAAFASVGAVIAAGEIRIPGTASPAGVTAFARVGTVTATGGGVFARAPAGNGYSPRRIETQSRPASIQRNNR